MIDDAPKSNTTNQAILGAIRTLLGILAGWAVGRGFIPADVAGELIGAVMILGPVIWSVYDKYRSERATKAREQLAVQAGAQAARTGTIAGVASTAIGPEHAQEIIKTLKESQ